MTISSIDVAMERKILDFMLAKSFGISADTRGVWQKVIKPEAQQVSEILIYGAIVPEDDLWIYQYFGDDSVVSGKMFKDKLEAIAGKPTVRINSPGGDVMSASVIVQAIQERGAVDCIVDGLAASAASAVMAACSHVTVAALAQVMIHEAWTVAYGNKRDLAAAIKLLTNVDSSLAEVYAKKMSKTAADVEAMIAEAPNGEIWMSAQEAVDAGLANQIFAKVEAEPEPGANAQGAPNVEAFMQSQSNRVAALLTTRGE